MSERDLEISILEWLRFHGAFCWKVNVKGFYDTKNDFFRKSNHSFDFRGQPDITCVLPDGRTIFIEVKLPGVITRGPKKGQFKHIPTDDQVWFIDQVNSKGGIAFVARSIEDVQQELQKHGYIIE